MLAPFRLAALGFNAFCNSVTRASPSKARFFGAAVQKNETCDHSCKNRDHKIALNVHVWDWFVHPDQNSANPSDLPLGQENANRALCWAPDRHHFGINAQ
jgi:hypothetical protein